MVFGTNGAVPLAAPTATAASKRSARTAPFVKGFDPDEPRVRAGNPDGGQWTDGGDGGADAASPGGSGSDHAPEIRPSGDTSTGGNGLDGGHATGGDGSDQTGDASIRGAQVISGLSALCLLG